MIHPSSGNHTSTQLWAWSWRTTQYSPTGFHSAPAKPFTIRAGTPIVRSITASPEAKYSQCPS